MPCPSDESSFVGRLFQRAADAVTRWNDASRSTSERRAFGGATRPRLLTRARGVRRPGRRADYYYGLGMTGITASQRAIDEHVIDRRIDD